LLPDPLAAIWGLLLREEEGRGEEGGRKWKGRREGEGKGGEGRDRGGYWKPLTHVWLRRCFTFI